MSNVEELRWEEKQSKKIIKKYETNTCGSDDEEFLDDQSGKDPDQFGFVQSAAFIALERKYLKGVNRTVKRRAKKWEKMFNNYPRARQKKLPNRVYKGVPKNMRARLWDALLDVDAVRDTYVSKNIDYLTLYKSAQTDAVIVRQIDLDVARTWRWHIKFRERYGKWQKYIFRILLAYSAFDVTVGYCQGMSQIAALLLIVFGEDEKAFWALCSLMNRSPWTQKGMFMPGFPKLNEFIGYWDAILIRQMPKIYTHLAEESLISQIYLTKWFLQNFLDRLPFRLAIRLWDCFLLDGDGVILATTLVLFRLNQTKIKRLEFEQLTQFLQSQICNISIPDDTFFFNIQKALETIKSMRVMQPSSSLVPTTRSQTLPAHSSPTPSAAVKKSKTLQGPSTGRNIPETGEARTQRTDLIREFIAVKQKPPIASPRKSQSSKKHAIKVNDNMSSNQPEQSTQSSLGNIKQPQPHPRQIRVKETDHYEQKISSQMPQKRIDVLPPSGETVIDRDKLDKVSEKVSDWVARYSRHSKDLIEQRKQIYFLEKIYGA